MKVAILEDVIHVQLIVERAVEKYFKGAEIYFFDRSSDLLRFCTHNDIDLIVADLNVNDTDENGTLQNLETIMSRGKTEILIHAGNPERAEKLCSKYQGWIQITRKDRIEELFSTLSHIAI